MSENTEYGYVTEYGNYGQDEIIIFKKDALTEKQWEHLSIETDANRIVYIAKILKGWDVSDMEK